MNEHVIATYFSAHKTLQRGSNFSLNMTTTLHTHKRKLKPQIEFTLHRVKEMWAFTCWCKCNLNCVRFTWSCFGLWTHLVHIMFFYVLNGFMLFSRQLGIWNSLTYRYSLKMISNIWSQGEADMVDQPREIIPRWCPPRKLSIGCIHLELIKNLFFGGELSL